jgi:hypothetical protein
MENSITLEELMAQSGTPVTTAFVVYQTPEGQWAVTPDLSIDLNTARQATMDDIISGTSAAHAGMSAQQTAMTMMVLMNQQAQALQQQAMQQQEAAKVSSLIDPRKLRNPNA